MRTLTLLFIFISSNYFCYAQDDTKTSNIPFSKNTIFFELAGNSLTLGMVNYDRILVNKEKWKFAGRLGFSFIPGRDTYFHLMVPSEFTFLVGRKKHFFEAGLGVTYFLEANIYGKDQPDDSQSSYYLFSRVGYRYQKPEGGFFLKVGFNTITPLNEYAPVPYYVVQRIAWPYGGLGIGYTFKQRKTQ